MPIPDKDELFSKLEALGEQQGEKLAQGVYAGKEKMDK